MPTVEDLIEIKNLFEACSGLLNIAALNEEETALPIMEEVESITRSCLSLFAYHFQSSVESFYKFDSFADDSWGQINCRLIISSPVRDCLYRKWMCVTVLQYYFVDEEVCVQNLVFTFCDDAEEYTKLMSVLDENSPWLNSLVFPGFKNQLHFVNDWNHIHLFEMDWAESLNSVILFDSVSCFCKLRQIW